MGMYTHLHLDIELKPKTKMLVESYIESVPRLSSTSHYFKDQGYNKIEVDESCTGHGARSWDDPDHRLTILHTDISLKNYDNEIDDFLAFLSNKTAMNQDRFIGFKRYEEDELPTLILWNAESRTFDYKKIEE